MYHLLKKFLRLRSFNALISFSACALRGDVELFLASLFRSCRLTSTGDELLSVRSHVACVSKHSQNKKNRARQGSGASIGCFASGGSKKNDAGQTLYAWTPPLEGLNTIISIAAKPLADVRNNAHDCVPCICHQSLEEAEVISFVPGALSIPRGPMFWYDNPCSDKALRFWQLASVVVDDGRQGLHNQFVSSVLERKIDGTGPGAVEVLAVEGSGGTEKRIVADCGKCWERTSLYKECGSTSLLKERQRNSF